MPQKIITVIEPGLPETNQMVLQQLRLLEARQAALEAARARVK